VLKKGAGPVAERIGGLNSCGTKTGRNRESQLIDIHSKMSPATNQKEGVREKRGEERKEGVCVKQLGPTYKVRRDVV